VLEQEQLGQYSGQAEHEDDEEAATDGAERGALARTHFVPARLKRCTRPLTVRPPMVR
jgi:hypothetical protein